MLNTSRFFQIRSTPDAGKSAPTQDHSAAFALSIGSSSAAAQATAAERCCKGAGRLFSSSPARIIALFDNVVFGKCLDGVRALYIVRRRGSLRAFPIDAHPRPRDRSPGFDDKATAAIADKIHMC